MIDTLIGWLTEQGTSELVARLIVAVVGCTLLLLVAALADWVTRKVLVRLVRTVSKRSRATWDDALVDSDVFTRASHLVPALVIYVFAPLALAPFPGADEVARTLARVAMAVTTMLTLDALLTAGHTIYDSTRLAKQLDIRTFIQLLRVAVFFLGSVAVFALLVGRSPLVFLSGLGAFSAVLLIVFRDTILGFVAGVQIQANHLVRPGDWVEMPKYGADGDVLEVNLTNVKIQNWDKTISSVPAYAFVSDSFKNWRGMSESGGRRIKRAINIDMSSIKFCDAEMINRFKKIQYITEYVEKTLAEVTDYNTKTGADTSLLVNGRHLTNVGTFRAYLVAYLRNHPEIHQDMTFLVRQLAPGEHGLPIEIYVFSKDQRWPYYEAIQADIFDHVLAILPLFDLRAYQSPAGSDVRALSTSKSD